MEQFATLPTREHAGRGSGSRSGAEGSQEGHALGHRLHHNDKLQQAGPFFKLQGTLVLRHIYDNLQLPVQTAW